jgi:phytoene dehydrogenase-like protein
MSKITRRGFVKSAALAPLALSSLHDMVQTSAPADRAGTSDRFDIVVAGAGHNSMIAAAYLAKAGYRVVLLEGRSTVGGGVKTAQFTLRGFKHDTCSTAHNAIQDNPMLRDNEIDLREYGLEYVYPDPVYHMPFADGTYITQWRDLERTCAELAKFSKKDAAAYRRMYAEFESVAPIFGAVTFAPIGFGKSLNDRLADHPKGKLWQRLAAMSCWQIIRSNFEDDHCRSFMMGCPLPVQPVIDPMTGRSAYSLFQQQRHSRPIPKGGSGALTEALARYIEAHGGVILTNKPVAKLVIENGRCAGVECADGSSYRADKAVLSTIHIKHLVDMAPHNLWGQDFLDGVETWQAEVQMFVVNYAATEPPTYGVAGGVITPVNSALVARPECALRVAYDFARSVVNLDEPPVAIHCTTSADPTRAPAGMHTIKVVGWQPYELKEGPEHWDVIKKQVADTYLSYIRRFSPNLTADKILAEVIQSPLDLERMNPHNWHGSCHAGAQSPAQSGALRPMAGWAQYRMPIPGLYQTGACTYPGGSVTGAPGRNAAVVMLKDFGTSIEQVVGKTPGKKT